MTSAAANATAPARARLVRRTELPHDTIALARWLIGKIVVRETPDGVASGRIVETEAYPPGDAAGHAFRGETPRNRTLFLRRGHCYVYRAYGLHDLFNVSSDAPGVGAGVLVRALEPLAGIGLMQQRRRIATVRDLARGPGRLAVALDIDRRLDGLDLCRKGPLWLAQDGHADADVGTSVRIGISLEAEQPLRFYLRGNRFASGPKSLSP